MTINYKNTQHYTIDCNFHYTTNTLHDQYFTKLHSTTLHYNYTTLQICIRQTEPVCIQEDAGSI